LWNRKNHDAQLWYSSVAAAKDPTHTHRLILLLCPSALIDTWLAELRARLGDAFRILLFHGSSLHTSDYLRKSLTVDTLSDLETGLRALDPTDIGTTRTIVLSSYSTWSMRNDLAIEQLAEMQAQTMDDDDTAGQDDFGSTERAGRGNGSTPTCPDGLAAWSAMKATRPRPSGHKSTTPSRDSRQSMSGS
jgi:hypothetical protein